ncbi:hypothetical protein BB8028_0006g01610 [Beauveria bassiana]|uniref:Uncharacterized protein n=1 Tax=Beauveria bassiana TaxID=176275 RepID=A0A2S7YIQ2_BEABA|nr:hypothetical protein BB8028_0006g01610 [Beauveria bassiana]
MLSCQSKEKRSKDRISKRFSRERQRKQRERNQVIQDLLGAFEPQLVSDSGWGGLQLGYSPTYHDSAPPPSERDDGIVSFYHDDPFTRLALTQVVSNSFDAVRGGCITSASPEPNEPPASADSAWSFQEIAPQAPAASSDPFANAVCASRNGNSSKRNADSRILPTKHQTTLHRAIVTGNVEIVRLLLHNGATINMQNHVGMTPLHLAVYYRNIALVTLLLQYNADLEARDMQGRKAVDLAVEAENFPIVELLIAHGTKI